MDHRSWVRTLALAAWLLDASPAPAADTPEPQYSPAPLVFKDRTIIEFRTPFIGLTPSERVQSATRRLTRLMEKYNGEPITTRPLPDGIAVQIHNEILFVITPGDAYGTDSGSLEMAADEAIRQLSLRDSHLPALPALPTAWIPSWTPKWGGAAALLVAAIAVPVWLWRQFFALRCPECEATGRELLSFTVDDSSSFWVLRKHHCRACGHEWIK